MTKILIHYAVLAGLSLFLNACTTPAEEKSVYLDTGELPAAFPPQFQGWWKGKSEWDYLHIAEDGMVKTVFPHDFRAQFNPAFTIPNSASYMKLLKNEGGVLYAISKEQRYQATERIWMEPVYYYVKFSYDFSSHILTYVQQPCGLTESDMNKEPEIHLNEMASNSCAVLENHGGQEIWHRTTTYFRT